MRIAFFIFAIFISTSVFTQELTQTIRGVVRDRDSEFTLPGASVQIISLSNTVGVSTDLNGNFELNNIPVGRHTIKVTFLGYEEAIIPNLLLGSAKELVLKIDLKESIIKLNTVEVKAKQQKQDVNNEMAFVSARSFSVDETNRYAASFDDPSRAALSFAGVSSTDDISNEIIVRGNSPRGLLWRLNGIEIPSPSHFSDIGASGGGVSVLSNNMLDNSDFFTAAFPAEYGNALSGVFDVKLRKGNQHKSEKAFQIGLLGTDISLEGPFRGENKGSYLINYRYSTLSMLTGLGILDFEENNKFQDLAFNIFLPTEKHGNFSLFGIGGLSLSEEETEKDTSEFETDRDYYDSKFNSDMGVLGLEHKYFFNNRTYVQTVVSISGQNIGFRVDSISKENLSPTRLYKEDVINKTSRGSILMNKKVDSKNTIRTGFIFSRLDFNLYARGRDEDDVFKTLLSSEDHTYTHQAFGQWKHSFNQQFTLNVGLHSMVLAMNRSRTIEPRLGLKWKPREGQAFNFGVGLHSRMESMSIYMARQTQLDGSYSQPNRNLELTKAIHYVIGYERILNENLHMKAEVYYQQLYDVPVENDLESTNSAINANAGFTTEDYVNEGRAFNYGTELTFERFFAKNYYYLFTASIFESKYKPLDGKTYNTRFNANYNFSLLGGKEYKMGERDKNLLSVNTKLIWAGGNRYTPIDLENSRLEGEEQLFEDRPFSEQVPDYWRLDLTTSYRINRNKSAHIISLQIQNVTNRENVFSYGYNKKTESIEEEYQFGMLPILKYRLEF